MGLRLLETKLSLQGALSGASDVSSEGVIKKFSLGGFSDSSNGIVNSAYVAPLPYTPGSKTSSLHSRDSQDASGQQENSSQSEPLVSNKYALSSKYPEPLAIFSFTKDDIDYLNAAIYQSYFEDRCSLEFSKALIKKVKQSDEKYLSSILGKVKEETSLAEGHLTLIEQYLNACLDLNSSHNSLQLGLIASQALSKFSELSPDALGLNGRGGTDPIALLTSVGAGQDVLNGKSNTALMSQLLYLAAMQMFNGATSLLLGNSNVFPNLLLSPDVPVEKFIEAKLTNDAILNLKILSLNNSTSENQSFVYPSIESVPYNSKLKLGLLQGGTPIQKAAYLATLFSNELAISTGLGKLDGTPLGQAFASTGNYKKNFWGFDTSVTDATTEATSPGSLNDFFVVSEDGTNRLTDQTGVLLFDGSRQPSNPSRKNVYDAFVVGSIRSPLDPAINKVQQLTDAQSAANARFDLGAQFYRQLHCRQGDIKLLTPRGLFSRLVSDFVDSLSLFQSQENAKGKQVRELCLLSVLGKNALAGSQYGGSAVSIIKRSLLGLMSKKALQLQYNLDTPAPKLSSKESQKPKSTTSKSKVTTKTGDTTTVSEVTSETFSDEQQENQGASFQFNPDPKNPRLCLDEKKLFDKRLQSELTDAVVIGFSELPAANSSNSNSLLSIDINVENFYDDIFLNQDGFIDKLVKIYVDSCKESRKMLDSAGESATAVDAARLTKNSQIDGTLLLALLLEAACQLASDFVYAGVSPDSGMFQIRQALKDSDIKDDKIKRNWLKYSQITLKFQAGESTQSALAVRALGAICRASDGNDLSSVFLPKNGNLVVPELGAVPQNTILSYDALGQTTIASVVDTFFDLAFERDLPAMCLAVTHGMVRYFDSVSSKYKDVSAQLLGIKKQTEDARRLSDFIRTGTGEKFFSSLNDFSLDAAKRKLNLLKKELLSDSGRAPKITLAELRCIQVVLESMKANTFTNNFVTVALPKDFVTKSVKSTYAVSVDRNNPRKDETAFIGVIRSPVFSVGSDNSGVNVFVRSPLNSNSFSAFENRTPSNFDEILTYVILDTGDSGGDFIQKKLDSNFAKTVLANEVVSYLLRRLFSTLSSADLFSDNISDFDAFPVDNNSANVARAFAQAYGLSNSIFDTVFTTLPDGTRRISEDNLIALTRLDFDTDNTNIAVSLPPLKFGEAELFYDLFESVYFQSGAVERRVFSVPLLDEVTGFLLPPPAQSDSQQVTSNGQVEQTGIQKSLAEQANTRQVPLFDTYSVTVELSQPLVNK